MNQEKEAKMLVLVTSDKKEFVIPVAYAKASGAVRSLRQFEGGRSRLVFPSISSGPMEWIVRYLDICKGKEPEVAKPTEGKRPVLREMCGSEEVLQLMQETLPTAEETTADRLLKAAAAACDMLLPNLQLLCSAAIAAHLWEKPFETLRMFLLKLVPSAPTPKPAHSRPSLRPSAKK